MEFKDKLTLVKKKKKKIEIHVEFVCLFDGMHVYEICEDLAYQPAGAPVNREPQTRLRL